MKNEIFESLIKPHKVKGDHPKRFVAHFLKQRLELPK